MVNLTDCISQRPGFDDDRVINVKPFSEKIDIIGHI